MSLASFGVHRPVAPNLLMFALLGAGLIFGFGLRREFFPEVRPNQVIVSAPYPGAAPEEVEQALAIKIEDQILELRDIEEVVTTVREGFATITVEYRDGVDIETAVAEVKREVDALQDLPADAERIVVAKLEPNLPVIVISIYGDAAERDMKLAIRRLRDDLKLLSGMGDIAIGGVRPDEIRVEVDPARVLELGLSLPQISQRINQHMRELPGGTVRSPTSYTAIRTVATEERAAQVRQIPVASAPGGRIVTLGEIATVRDTFADIDLRSRLNGRPAASLTIYKVGDQDAVDMANLVKAYAAGLRGEAIDLNWRERLSLALRPPTSDRPPSERVRAWQLGRQRAQETPLPGEVALTTDLARFIVGRLDLLTRNAVAGMVLVFLTLLLLLNWRTSFWVAVGLVVSISATLTAMRFLGVTLNLLTMFGLIIVLGLLVDDAIVVAENITRRHEQGETAQTAAILGAEQVQWPVLATVVTTICAFLPLALIEGRMGDLLQWLPAVVAIALGVSLLEALFILPTHIGHSAENADRRRLRGRRSWFERIEGRFDAARDGFIYGLLIPWYVRTIQRLLRMRYLTVTIAVALVIASLAMPAGGRLEFILFEDDDAETVNAEVRMAIGTPTDRTDEVVRMVEAVALDMPEVANVYASTGAQGDLEGALPAQEQPHLGQLILELVPVEQRDRTSKQVIDEIRRRVGQPPGVKSLRLQGVGAGPQGAAVTLTLAGDDIALLTRTAERVATMLAEYDGIYDIADDTDLGQRELRLDLRPGAAELGLSVQDVAQQMRAAVVGLEAYTFAGDREDVDVRVTLPERTRRDLEAIESLWIFTPAGDAVPLGEVVRIEETRSYATIRRLDGERAITVTADATEGTNPEQVMADLRPRLIALERETPGVRILERGRQKDVRESFQTLPLGMAVAAGLIYVILTWLFSSYAQPLIVMSAIPFAIIGMVWGHVLMGYPMTFLSLIGFVALSGVVVNDSLILMQFFNEQRARGVDVPEALIEAGRNRVRAILLTTVTTVLGLSPLMLERSFQAQFLIPMAITISFGLMSATAIILIVLPCLLLILDDAKRFGRMIWTGQPPEPRPVPRVDPFKPPTTGLETTSGGEAAD